MIAATLVAALAAPISPLQHAVDAYVDADRTRSVAVALVTPAGVEFAAAGDGIDADSPFEIGSLTKTFTGALLAALVADGTVTLDTTVGALAPPELALDDAIAAITLRELATHTSGLPRMPADPDMLKRLLLNPADPYAGTTSAGLYASVAALDGLLEPGEENYSNLGVALLGRLLERAAGAPYEALVRARILEPRGLEATTFDAHGVGGHRKNLQPTPDWHLDAYNPAGGLVSTARDMAAYLAAEMDAEAGANLSWFTSERDGMRWHNGRTGGYASFAAFLPGSGRAIVVLTSGGASPDAFGAALLRGEAPTIERPASAGPFWFGFTVLFAALAPLALILLMRQPFARLDYLSALLDGAWLLALTWTLGAWLQIPLAFWYAVLAIVLALAVLQARRAPGSPWLLRGRPWHNAGVVVGLPLKLLLLVWIVARL